MNRSFERKGRKTFFILPWEISKNIYIFHNLTSNYVSPLGVKNKIHKK